MADHSSKPGSVWPMPKFKFEVDLGSPFNGVTFQEVSGLDVDTLVVPYRSSNNPLFSTAKMPGIVKYGSVILKRGLFIGDHSFWNLHAEIEMNAIKRRTILIKLLDESGQVTMQWSLSNAWPAKIGSTDLKSDANEVAVDTLEIAYEQLSTTHGK